MSVQPTPSYSCVKCEDLIDLFNTHCATRPSTIYNNPQYNRDCVISGLEKDANTPFYYVVKKCRLKHITDPDLMTIKPDEHIFNECCILNDKKCIKSLHAKKIQ